MKDKLLKYFIDKQLKIKSIEKLEEYISFCIDNDMASSIKGETDLHHILPKAKDLFAEFNNLRKYKWNGVYLTFIHHYEAHALLFEAIDHIQIAHGWHMMHTRKSKGLTIEISSSRYEQLRTNHASYLLGKMSMKDNKGNLYYLSNSDERFLSGEFTAITKNMTTVKDSKGNTMMVDINDNRIEKGELVGVTKGIPLSEEHKKKISDKNKGRNNHTNGINPNSKKIIIFNSKNKVMFETYGNFKEICAINNLPKSALYESYSNGGKPIWVSNMGRKRAITQKKGDFVGWYAKIVE